MSEIAAAAQAALAAVLGAAGAIKLGDVGAFEASLRSYGWLPDRWTRVVARSVPVAELGLAVAIWITPIRFIALVGAGALIAVFTVFLIRLVLRGKDEGCGCFGSAPNQRVTWFSVLRNVLLLGAVGLSLATNEVEIVVPALLTGAGVAALLALVDTALSAGPRP